MSRESWVVGRGDGPGTDFLSLSAGGLPLTGAVQEHTQTLRRKRPLSGRRGSPAAHP